MGDVLGDRQRGEFRDVREPSYVKDVEGMGNGLNSDNEAEGRTEC